MRADDQATLNRLRRIEGQVRGLQRMVEDDAYCIDILTQVAAVRTALEQVALRVLDGHVRGCVAEAVGGDGGDEKLDELMAAVERFAKVR
jgi:DNA-binding FrmR family transcriptional regulator